MLRHRLCIAFGNGENTWLRALRTSVRLENLSEHGETGGEHIILGGEHWVFVLVETGDGEKVKFTNMRHTKI